MMSMPALVALWLFLIIAFVAMLPFFKDDLYWPLLAYGFPLWLILLVLAIHESHKHVSLLIGG